MRRLPAALVGGILLTVAAAQPPALAISETAEDGRGSLVMVLDSSGSMADDDGSGGGSRIAAAREAIGRVVDALPDGYPTGLRLYGADRRTGCEDTRLARPVKPLDRAALKRAVAEVEPKGDTPIGRSLREAAKDLPAPAAGSVARRTIVLISDGEDNCGAPDPCEVARELGEKGGVGLRIDTVGFQVRGKARAQLECVAEAGHGSYYDAPDADALARQLQRAAELSAAGYRFEGDPITGGSAASTAAGIGPGQYIDTLGPGETRWYGVELDDASAADLSVTAVPQPGVAVHRTDKLEAVLTATDRYRTGCDRSAATFGSAKGAMTLGTAVSRVPSAAGGRPCDQAGRFLLSVARSSDPGSDRARWPIELRFGLEHPLKAGLVPAQSATEYGDAGQKAVPPTGTPEDVAGGTGFNDAVPLERGVWRDRLLPGQTRYYKVRVGWGQQLRYAVDFANEPTLKSASGVTSSVETRAYAPGRLQVSGGFEFGDGRRPYRGKPTSVQNGTVPVSWTNRYESRPEVRAVRSAGEYWITVSLGADAAEIAENASIGLLLRVDVVGDELAGPEHGAPVLGTGGARDGQPASGGEGAPVAGGGERAAGGWSRPALLGGIGGLVAVLAAAGYLLARRGRGAGRGRTWSGV
ncbi:vWA domain-containing protein [Streptomyces sp. TP-A0874]|uniref:vWA domain-containing protein n=1 Tax=Streptomyces sp. TP-A0874 TaxID=549819 RepID=UPI000852B354|nr:VWA domain-containing protein [Streptomyces sp. TP-A0874]